MPGSGSLFHAVQVQIERVVAGQVRATRVTRLAQLVAGVVAARSTVLAAMAAVVVTLRVSAASTPAAVEQGLRRAVSDARLDGRGFDFLDPKG